MQGVSPATLSRSCTIPPRVAALTPVFQSSVGSPLNRQITVAVFGATAADTVELVQWFKRVTWWAWIPATGASSPVDSTTVTTNTKVTIPASVLVDDGLIVAYGSGAQQVPS